MLRGKKKKRSGKGKSEREEGKESCFSNTKTYSLFYKLPEQQARLIPFIYICPGERPIGTGLPTPLPLGDRPIKAL